MTPVRFILYLLLAYFLYRFVVNFLWPVIKVSRQMKRQVREFQRHAQQQETENYQKNNTTANASSNGPTAAPRPKAEDYIDFEEVK